MTCAVCGKSFDPARDTFLTINERKSAAVNVDSLACATQYLTKD